jgi:hypothetical protein
VEKTVSETTRKPKTITQVECELFALAAVGGDGNRVIVYNRLRRMTPKQRHHLRQSIERLDGLLDQVALDLHLERHKSKTKGANRV